MGDNRAESAPEGPEIAMGRGSWNGVALRVVGPVLVLLR